MRWTGLDTNVTLVSIPELMILKQGHAHGKYITDFKPLSKPHQL